MSRTITVSTGARLHFGPLSYHPQSGRHFGGVGVMTDEPGFRISFRKSERDAVIGNAATADRVRHFVSSYRTAGDVSRRPPACEITIDQELPFHSGLGSGTQLGLAIARGLAMLAGEQSIDAAELACRVGRGRRSAIGIHGFEFGGLIVDAGQTGSGKIGALACRLAMPSEWRVLLITPGNGDASLFGEGEERAFETLNAMPTELTERLCRIVLTEMMPAVQTRSIDAFSHAVEEYGRLVGEFFAPVQGGVFGHPRADALISQLRELGIHGAGQTSWGPTVFAFVGDETSAHQAATALSTATEVRIVGLRNSGATVQVQDSQSEPRPSGSGPSHA